MTDPDSPKCFHLSRRGPLIWAVTAYSMVMAPGIMIWDTVFKTTFAAVAAPILLGAIVAAPTAYLVDRTIRLRNGGGNEG